jgi:K+-sensing histidine kinase KdpD
MSSTPARAGTERGVAKAAPRRFPDPPRRVLLATPARPIGPEVLARTIEIATPEHAKITVLGIARIYGTSLGLPHPGLQPTKPEWEQLRGYVEAAAMALRRQGFEVRVGLTRSRNAPKMIAKWVRAKNFHAVVVPGQVLPRWRQLFEGDLAHEITRRCGVQVHAVTAPVASRWGSRPA